MTKIYFFIKKVFIKLLFFPQHRQRFSVNCTVFRNLFLFYIQYKTLTHQSTVKFTSQVDKLLTVNNKHENNICVK